ncbi:MAG: translation initiation factor III [Micavibrio sp.]|nr:translation initiation factor III [Micavibrio sp.]|tara:strand:- start:273 stop:674 length:402 start_codon:yes stop_codon:yes gene_type:complete
MRHGTSNSRRQRGRGGNNRRNNQRTQVFDSNGPDVRIRGTAHQVTEKYMTLAKDAAAAGDRIMAESYLQHAEHYQRIINSWEEAAPERSQRQEKSTSPEMDNDDLSLPGSILGGGVNVDNAQEAARTAEMADC